MAEESRLDYRDPEWVAKQLGIDKNAVYRYLDEGTLPGLRLGRKWLISESRLAEFLKSQEREQTERRRAGLRRGSALPFQQFIKQAKGRLTERATRALRWAWEEALERRHDRLGQEHLLLGLLREPDSVAARVLQNLGFDVRAALETRVGCGSGPVSGEIDLTPRARQTLELAVKESRRLSHHYIGTEHLLLGIVRAGEGLGFELLREHGISPQRVQAEVERLLSQPRAGLSGATEEGDSP